jgi:predicted HicB family RNase H-like nuclease
MQHGASLPSRPPRGLSVITEPAAAPAAAPPSPCDVRLATRITGGVDRRLRLAALVRRMPLNQFLDRLLDQALPPVGELAGQIQGGAPDGH